ncbi:hypothetical protein EGW08_000261 [Elysia chlorotica]|uniref:Uncharacterized protein n=1 Tax=Elysia chlorotica TaxID=188477 RepID=A0A433UE41_ELYCH|nr:hypothetical protein EGW08_000261 [Elysia chlorotica]
MVQGQDMKSCEGPSPASSGNVRSCFSVDVLAPPRVPRLESSGRCPNVRPSRVWGWSLSPGSFGHTSRPTCNQDPTPGLGEVLVTHLAPPATRTLHLDWGKFWSHISPHLQPGPYTWTGGSFGHTSRPTCNQDHTPGLGEVLVTHLAPPATRTIHLDWGKFWSHISPHLQPGPYTWTGGSFGHTSRPTCNQDRTPDLGEVLVTHLAPPATRTIHLDWGKFWSHISPHLQPGPYTWTGGSFGHTSRPTCNQDHTPARTGGSFGHTSRPTCNQDHTPGLGEVLVTHLAPPATRTIHLDWGKFWSHISPHLQPGPYTWTGGSFGHTSRPTCNQDHTPGLGEVLVTHLAPPATRTIHLDWGKFWSHISPHLQPGPYTWTGGSFGHTSRPTCNQDHTPARTGGRGPYTWTGGSFGHTSRPTCNQDHTPGLGEVLVTHLAPPATRTIHLDWGKFWSHISPHLQPGPYTWTGGSFGHTSRPTCNQDHTPGLGEVLVTHLAPRAICGLDSIGGIRLGQGVGSKKDSSRADIHCRRIYIGPILDKTVLRLPTSVPEQSAPTVNTATTRALG